MEPHPGTATGPHRLRPLNQAQPVRLQPDPATGAPSAVELRGRWRRVARVEEVWRVEDGWWRPNPVSRTYFRLALEDGRAVTLFRERRPASPKDFSNPLDSSGPTSTADSAGTWWLQRY